MFWQASILRPIILTMICMFGSAMCDDAEFTSVESDAAICTSATPVLSARSDIECAVACSGNPNCKTFGHATPFVQGSCFVSEMGDCTLMRDGKMFRKSESCFAASGPMATGKTVMFMQRYVGDVNFSKPWSDYDNGFGNCGGDFWLGLRNIKNLLASNSATLRMEMKSWAGQSLHVEYHGFTVGDSSTNYLINYAAIGDKSSMLIGAGLDNNAAFSTMDRDNDKSYSACAQITNGNGGFWMNNCGYVYPTAAFPLSDNPNLGYMVWHNGTSMMSLREFRMYLKR